VFRTKCGIWVEDLFHTLKMFSELSDRLLEKPELGRFKVLGNEFRADFTSVAIKPLADDSRLTGFWTEGGPEFGSVGFV
jgi:hypothetical protein